MRSTTASQRKVEVVRAWPARPGPAGPAPLPEGQVPASARAVERRASVPSGARSRPVPPRARRGGAPNRAEPVRGPEAPPGAVPMRTSLPGDPRAAASARRFVRATLREWTTAGARGAEDIGEALVDEAVLLVSELVTNAVVHAGTGVDVRCHLDTGTSVPDHVVDGARPDAAGAPDHEAAPAHPVVVVEVRDHHPARAVRGHEDRAGVEAASGRGLQLVGTLAESWGITYSHASKTVWFRLVVASRTEDAAGPRPETRTAGATPSAFVPGRSTYGMGAWTPHPEHTAHPPSASGAPATLPGSAAPGADDEHARVPAEAVPHAGECVGAPHCGPGAARAPRESEAPAASCAAPEQRWPDHGALSFLAEASDLLGGQLDADQVAALTAQLLVPRVADWCAVWLDDAGATGADRGPETPAHPVGEGGGVPRLARVWHANESCTDALRAVLETTPPGAPLTGGGLGGAPTAEATPWTWPAAAHPAAPDGAALACALVAGGRSHGTLVMGRAGLRRFPGAVVGLLEDLSRRVARALATAHAYSRQERISRVLQRRLLPKGRPAVPGLESAVVYEPREGAWAGGDFWDLFDAGEGRWCFALGDVCGSGPEAAAVTGLARPVLRLLARDGFGVADVLDRLNKTMTREAADSVMAFAAAVAVADPSRPEPSAGLRHEDEQTRFLSLLYGEIVPHPGGRGARCTLASAGHPLPLVLGADGRVRVVAAPQMLLGVVEDAVYQCEAFDLAPGETLLCVTDGVTERRSGRTQFDDRDGLAAALAECDGLTAEETAERIRRTVHAFAPTPPDDDLALLVLRALPADDAPTTPEPAYLLDH